MTSFLIVLNLLLFWKLNFFFNRMLGQTTLFDFDAYFRLIKDIGSGLNPYSVQHMQTLGPPLVFLYYMPFSALSINLARGVFTFVNVSLGITSCYLLAKYFYPKSKINVFLLLNLLFFSAFPIRFSIEMGQANIVAVFLITLLITSNNRDIKSIALAFLISLKTFFAFTLVSFFGKNKGVLYKTSVFITLLIILSFFVIKPKVYQYYFRQKLSPVFLVSSEKSMDLDYYNQSISATMTRLKVNNLYLPVYIIALIFLATKTYKLKSFELGIVSSILLSPVVWQHYFAVLFPILIYLFVKLKFNRFLIIAFTLFWIEIPTLHTTNPNFLTAIIASHFFISAVIVAILIISIENNKEDKKTIYNLTKN